MWICSKCGEPHEDQFKECWQCAAHALDRHVTAAPPKPPLPRPLRSTGSIVWRVAIGFSIGMLLGVAAYHRAGVPLMEAALVGAILGAVIGISVGIFLWVLFPYEPTLDMPDHREEEYKSD